MSVFSFGADNDIFVGENRFYNFSDAAKIIGIKGLGRSNLFKLLRDRGVLNRWNHPTKEFKNMGYFRIVENKHLTPLISNYGINYIKKKIL
jgi:anti-repressor protein